MLKDVTEMQYIVFNVDFSYFLQLQLNVLKPHSLIGCESESQQRRRERQVTRVEEFFPNFVILITSRSSKY